MPDEQGIFGSELGIIDQRRTDTAMLLGQKQFQYCIRKVFFGEVIIGSCQFFGEHWQPRTVLADHLKPLQLKLLCYLFNPPANREYAHLPTSNVDICPFSSMHAYIGQSC